MATRAMREDNVRGPAIVVFQETVGAGRRSVRLFTTPITREPFRKCYHGPLRT